MDLKGIYLLIQVGKETVAFPVAQQLSVKILKWMFSKINCIYCKSLLHKT